MNTQTNCKTTLTAITVSIWSNRQLIFQLTKREVLGRYRGSVVGIAWSVLNPLLMLAVYTFFFSVIFQARWGANPTQNNADFAIILFVGLIIHSLFTECVNRAPSLIANNVNYVKKIIFPLEILPCITLCAALFHTIISITILLIIQLVLTGSIKWTVIFFPIILFPLLLVTLGAAWFLAATGVYLRDISQITVFVTSILLFLSPVFYPLSILPPTLQTIIVFNPLALIIEQSRNVLIFGEMPHWNSFAIYTMCSICIAWLGFWIFQKTRGEFADVL